MKYRCKLSQIYDSKNLNYGVVSLNFSFYIKTTEIVIYYHEKTHPMFDFSLN